MRPSLGNVNKITQRNKKYKFSSQVVFLFRIMIPLKFLIYVSHKVKVRFMGMQGSQGPCVMNTYLLLPLELVYQICRVLNVFSVVLEYQHDAGSQILQRPLLLSIIGNLVFIDLNIPMNFEELTVKHYNTIHSKI